MKNPIKTTFVALAIAFTVASCESKKPADAGDTSKKDTVLKLNSTLTKDTIVKGTDTVKVDTTKKIKLLGYLFQEAVLTTNNNKILTLTNHKT
ncbi:hypothetical protein NAF17_07515 [Mucilaginibacter sp. RB4R14]|uniref:hypothetical protein n=1 Tax=Mucilaginibacter aurantiaciroseus TaxID=2949308 RepID=UPI0020916C2E|nr:hypothetical protein [Mucilaginibacter aurantiaciroseus]MCO5935384.1 hypothetical protein [Mucilaginibacter aurantiaciroseus]